jgi:hypothetical protein
VEEGGHVSPDFGEEHEAAGPGIEIWSSDIFHANRSRGAGARDLNHAS